MELSYVIYQSRALIPKDSPEHDKILAKCAERNSASHLTGFLYYEGGVFLQYLEGPKIELDTTLMRIEGDVRHENVEVLDQGTITKRYLPDWQMGFVNEDTISLTELLEAEDGVFSLKTEDPFDLVTFMVMHADQMRERLSA